ncbi:hypothetical protein OCGS_0113 [Oceaniovalibus guishaninsula JLT2003]|uniref:Lipoprotein n=1 Tax=Oceaniovalibus guishaninsula JLT2003 TaxID=1231392 RepID=K2HHI4_9RHOB|nr:hypothetical protein [Oceaniovalibus guishaninsula]EKE45887.1 hypothetical protein OCGS_0113 [Oceaniovalibus guishaninsula JLT2003]
MVRILPLLVLLVAACSRDDPPPVLPVPLIVKTYLNSPVPNAATDRAAAARCQGGRVYRRMVLRDGWGYSHLYHCRPARR